MRPVPEQHWVFNASHIHVVDADTFDVQIDVGFHMIRTERIRLLDVWAPERFTPNGKLLTAHLKLWLEEADRVDLTNVFPLRIQTSKSDAFGRYLAIVWNSRGECLNDLMNDWIKECSGTAPS